MTVYNPRNGASLLDSASDPDGDVLTIRRLGLTATPPLIADADWPVTLNGVSFYSDGSSFYNDGGDRSAHPAYNELKKAFTVYFTVWDGALESAVGSRDIMQYGKTVVGLVAPYVLPDTATTIQQTAITETTATYLITWGAMFGGDYHPPVKMIALNGKDVTSQATHNPDDTSTITISLATVTKQLTAIESVAAKDGTSDAAMASASYTVPISSSATPPALEAPYLIAGTGIVITETSSTETDVTYTIDWTAQFGGDHEPVIRALTLDGVDVLAAAVEVDPDTSTYVAARGASNRTLTATMTAPASDGTSPSASDSETVTVLTGADPVAVGDSLEVDTLAVGEVDVLANDTGVDLRVTGASATSGALTTIVFSEELQRDVIRYEAGGTVGTDTITYTIRQSDGRTAQGTVSVTITDPVITASLTTNLEGTFTTFSEAVDHLDYEPFADAADTETGTLMTALATGPVTDPTLKPKLTADGSTLTIDPGTWIFLDYPEYFDVSWRLLDGTTVLTTGSNLTVTTFLVPDASLGKELVLEVTAKDRSGTRVDTTARITIPVPTAAEPTVETTTTTATFKNLPDLAALGVTTTSTTAKWS